jgi:hypothetical protein
VLVLAQWIRLLFYGVLCRLVERTPSPLEPMCSMLTHVMFLKKKLQFRPNWFLEYDQLLERLNMSYFGSFFLIKECCWRYQNMCFKLKIKNTAPPVETRSGERVSVWHISF